MSKTSYVTRTQTLLVVKQNSPLFKTIDDLDYKSLPTQTTQQILQVVCKNMKDFINASKDFYKNPQKYKDKPKVFQLRIGYKPQARL